MLYVQVTLRMVHSHCWHGCQQQPHESWTSGIRTDLWNLKSLLSSASNSRLTETLGKALISKDTDFFRPYIIKTTKPLNMFPSWSYRVKSPPLYCTHIWRYISSSINITSGKTLALSSRAFAACIASTLLCLNFGNKNIEGKGKQSDNNLYACNNLYSTINKPWWKCDCVTENWSCTFKCS